MNKRKNNSDTFFVVRHELGFVLLLSKFLKQGRDANATLSSIDVYFPLVLLVPHLSLKEITLPKL